MTAKPALLLVEDNEDDVFLMLRAVKNAGIEVPVQVAQDGRQALDYLSGDGQYTDRAAYPFPTLILLDIKLPQVSGLEVLRWIRSQPELRSVVCIVLTSSNHPGDLREAYELGANSFIVKPPSFEQLVEFAKSFKSYWLEWNRTPA